MGKNCVIFSYQTPFGNYIYDANHNEILCVNSELFEYIQDYEKNELKKTEDYSPEILQEFQELQEFGYLLPPVVEKIEHPYTSMIGELLERKVEQVILQVTQSCNLRCSYCIYSIDSNLGQRSHSNKHMTFEIAKEALEFYKEHSTDSKVAAIGFYGGEPLLEFPLIKQVVEYAEDLFKGKKISFAITTNATLLSEEYLDFLIKHKFIITISIDGPQKIQDKNRKFADGKGTYNIVKENLHKFYVKYPEEIKKITVSMVVDTDSDYKDIVDLFAIPELKDVGLTYTPVEVDGKIQTLSEEYIENYAYDLFRGYIEYFDDEDEKKYPSKLVEQDLHLVNSTVTKFKKNELGIVSAPSGPCLPGKTRLFVNCLGEIYPCERVNENDRMKIGTLKTGFDYTNISEILNIGKLTESKCKDCWAFQMCDMCAKRLEKEGTFSKEKKLIACQNAKRSAFTKIRVLVLDYEVRRHKKKMKQLANKNNSYLWENEHEAKLMYKSFY